MLISGLITRKDHNVLLSCLSVCATPSPICTYPVPVCIQSSNMIKILLIAALLSYSLTDIIARTLFSVCEKRVLCSKIYRLAGGISSARYELHQETIALCWGFSRALRFLNLANQKLKCPANILIVSRARFCPAALEFLGQLLALFGADLALLWSKIALVTYDDDGNGFGTLCVISRHVCQRWSFCHGWSLRGKMGTH